MRKEAPINQSEKCVMESFAKSNSKISQEYFFSRVTWQINLLGFFILVIILNFFQNTALLIGNCHDQDYIEDNYYYGFHVLDFAQGFVFASIEALVLV